MVVSACGAFLGTKVDPSVRIIHLYEQTKWRIQLQAMLAQKVNGELLVTLALLVAFVARAVENNAVIGQFIHETAAQQSAGAASPSLFLAPNAPRA